MLGIQEELARARVGALRAEARRSNRAARLVALRRWQRRAESAARRAQAARSAVR